MNRGNVGPTHSSSWRFPFWSLLWIFLLLNVLLLLRAGDPHEVSYSDFKAAIGKGHVAEVTFEDHRILGTWKHAKDEKGQPRSTTFTSVMPPLEDATLIALLERHQVRVKARETAPPWWAGLILSLLPWIFLIGIFMMVARTFRARMQGMDDGGQALFGFGRSRAQRYRRDQGKITFDDVAGLENAKAELKEVVGFLSEPERFQALGARIPKGILLIGPPGTGKTLLARAVAGEARVPFFSISGSEFIEMFVGVGAARVRDMFRQAKQEAPSVLFIDEIDSVGRSRGTGLGGGHDEREQTLNQILAEMDGFSPNDKVVVIAATNRPDVLDPALLRPGRFDRKTLLDLPHKAARVKILRIHTRRVPLAPEVELEQLANSTAGFSGADLANLVNEAALTAGRNQKSQVDAGDFEHARDVLLMGHQREDGLTDVEKRRVAVHESGHALLAWVLPGADPLRKVTIIPRGRGMGATEQLPREEMHSKTRAELEDRLAVLLGGRVAERLVLGEVTSGADDDLDKATRLARAMVTRWGMSERLGASSFRYSEEHVFLGRELTRPREFSEDTARLIDEETRHLVDEAERHARQVLEEKRSQLDRVIRALIEKETLERSDVDQLLRPPESTRLARVG